MSEIGSGWELHIERLCIQTCSTCTDALYRTYGQYSVYIGGVLQKELQGYTCECIGPGDNTKTGSEDHVRLAEGTYPLWTQFGTRYVTIGYSEDTKTPAVEPMPAILLGSTGARSAILFHPGHPPHLYLSSIGCINPTSPIKETECIDFWDSRTRVINVINSLKAYYPAAFQEKVSTQISGAQIVIHGEPTEDTPSTARVAAAMA